MGASHSSSPPDGSGLADKVKLLRKFQVKDVLEFARPAAIVQDSSSCSYSSSSTSSSNLTDIFGYLPKSSSFSPTLNRNPDFPQEDYDKRAKLKRIGTLIKSKSSVLPHSTRLKDKTAHLKNSFGTKSMNDISVNKYELNKISRSFFGGPKRQYFLHPDDEQWGCTSSGIVTLHKDNTVETMVEVLHRYHISSAPVYTVRETSLRTVDNCLGFVDVLDLCALLLEYEDEQEQLVISAEEARGVEFYSSSLGQWIQTDFRETRVGRIINLSKRNPFNILNEQNALVDAVELFAQGVHRIAIVDPYTRQITHILTQSGLLTFFKTNWSKMGGLREFTIEGLGLGTQFCKNQPVISIDQSSSVAEALRVMSASNLSAIAITHENRLVDAFSASDLKGIQFDALIRLQLPLFRWKESPRLCVIHPATKLGGAVDTMIVNRIHRVYIVGPGDQLIGVVSLTDVFTAVAEIIPTAPAKRKHRRFLLRRRHSCG